MSYWPDSQAFDYDDFPCWRCEKMTNYRKFVYVDGLEDRVCPDCADELEGDEE